MAEGDRSNPFASASIFPPSTTNKQSSIDTNSAFSSSSAPQSSQAVFAGRGSGRGALRGSRASYSSSSIRGQLSGRGKASANRSVVFSKEPSTFTNNDDNKDEDEEIGQMSQLPIFDNTSLSVNADALLDSNTARFNGTSSEDEHPYFSSKIAPSTSAASDITGTPTQPTEGNETSTHTTSVFHATNVLGGSKEMDDIRKRRFEDLPKQNRFFEMKHQRDALRLEYIRQGVLPDPDKAQDLSAAKSLLGTCMEMCSEFERQEREFQNEGDALEMFPNSNRIDPALAVKIYRRPAAGRELPLPEDVRPPSILRKTLDYLFHQLLPSDPASPQFTAVQPFMWNRTRAIRQDFIVQGLRCPLEIECHERIARYHILCLHWKGGVGAEGWSEQQELEQLRKTIRSLTEFYEDLRRSTGKNSPNEAEFRAYNLLLHMQDPETLREVEVLPADVFDSPSIQAALRLRGYAQRSNNVVKRGRPLNTEATMNLWTRFFGEIKGNENVSYLLACLAENAFSQVRAGAIKAMGNSYLVQHAPLPLEYLRRTLGMDDIEEARKFCTALNCEEARTGGDDSPVNAMRVAKVNEDKPLPVAPFSKTIVEVKRSFQSSQVIVDGTLSGAAPLLPVEGGPFVTNGQAPRLPDVPRKAPPSDSRASPLPIPPTTLPLPAASTPASTTFKPVTRTTPATISAFGSSLSAAAPIFTPSTIPSSIGQLSEATSVSASPSFVKSTGMTSPFNFPQQPPSSSNAHVPLGTAPTYKLPAFLPTATTTVATPIEGKRPFSFLKTEEKSTPLDTSSSTKRKVDSPPPLSKVQKPAFQMPAELPKVQQAMAAPPTKPKRTISSVASSLYRTLLAEFLASKVETIGEQACLRQLRIRRKEARERCVNDTTLRLLEMMRVEIVDNLITSLSSEAVADEFRIRSLEKLAIRGRERAVKRAVERKRQAERLAEVRSKLGGRGLPYLVNNSRHVHRGGAQSKALIGAVDDRDLQMMLHRAKEERRSLWTPNTFLHTIEKRLCDIAPQGISPWTVGLSICKDTSSTSKWLRSKLSIDGEAEIEESYREGDKIRVVDFIRISKSKLLMERDVGMVIFELSPADNSNDQDWNSQSERLERLSQQSMIKESRYHPILLIISWNNGESLHMEEWRRKSILKRLHLGATDAQRFLWSKIEICCFGSNVTSPQANFQKSIQSILKVIEWNPRKLRLDFETVSGICKASWRNLLEQVEIAFNQSYEYEGATKKKEIALQTFNTLSILANQCLADLLCVSDTLLETPQIELIGIATPLSGLAADERRQLISQADNVDKLLLQLALMQLKDCHEESKDDTFLLIESWLLEYYNTQSVRFPWLTFFERLFQWHIQQIEDIWLECNLTNRDDIEAKVEATTSLCQAAWKEIEWKFKEVILTASFSASSSSTSTSPVKSISPLKRRGTDQRETTNGITNGNNKYKSRKVDKISKSTLSLPSTTTSSSSPSSPSSSTTTASLRALMTSATHLLQDKSYL